MLTWIIWFDSSDGRQERVMFDKITSRIQKLCYGLNMDFVDPVSKYGLYLGFLASCDSFYLSLIWPFHSLGKYFGLVFSVQPGHKIWIHCSKHFFLNFGSVLWVLTFQRTIIKVSKEENFLLRSPIRVPWVNCFIHKWKAYSKACFGIVIWLGIGLKFAFLLFCLKEYIKVI